MTAEFTNIVLSIDNLLEHAFRVQAARSHEFEIFTNRMKEKYPNSLMADMPTRSGNLLRFSHTKYWSSLKDQLVIYEECSETDKDQFKLKFKRMYEAKIRFEMLAEGSYEKFRK